MRAAGMDPDAWQRGLLHSQAPYSLLCCSRQAGKTTLLASVAAKAALLEDPALVLVVTPSERQSGEVVQRVKDLYEALSRPRRLAAPVVPWYDKMTADAGKDQQWVRLPEKVRESALQLHLSNGSRVIGLPAVERTVRVYSGVSLLVIDEAARVPDDLYRTMRPMLATSKGRLLAASTPFGKRGWFWEEWTGGGAWGRTEIKASQCPRIPPEFLAAERLALGERWYAQEYDTSFEEAVGAVFTQEAISRAVSGAVAPLWG
jgi:hypothetical protein